MPEEILPDPTPTPASPPTAVAPEPPKPTPPATPAAPATGDDGTDWKAEAEKYKALSRKHERRQLEALGFDPETIEKIRSEQKDGKSSSTLDALRERIDALEAERNAAVEQANRAAVAQAKGLTEAQAARLVGSTREELLADADALLASFPTAPIPKAPSADGQGPVGSPVGSAGDIDDQIAAATKAGNHTLAISLKRQKAYANKP